MKSTMFLPLLGGGGGGGGEGEIDQSIFLLLDSLPNNELHLSILGCLSDGGDALRVSGPKYTMRSDGHSQQRR